MSIQVKLSLEENTLNKIWRADRKRGQTFWSNMGQQFAVMCEATYTAKLTELNLLLADMVLSGVEEKAVNMIRERLVKLQNERDAVVAKYSAMK